MTRPFTQTLNLLRLLPRALLLTLVVAAPVLAMPSIRGEDENIIVSQSTKNSGAGLVLMVSLQRN